jgi:hypothetical protein
VHHDPAGFYTVDYDVQIDGVRESDSGATGCVQLGVDDPAILADLGAVADVLSAEFTKSNAAISS